MAKKADYLELAQCMYVQEQLTPSQIAERLNLGEKTVRNWKDEYNWDIQRRDYIASKMAFHEELYDFVRTMLEQVRSDMKEGKDPSMSKVSLLKTILPSITRIKDYEDAKVKATNDPKSKSTATATTIANVEEILGIIRK